MNELDLLKKHWDKDNNFPKVNKKELGNMLHKSSTSIVKWIFIICCLELMLGVVLFAVFPSEQPEYLVLNVLDWIYDLIFYIIIFCFIYRFYTLYVSIKNTSSVRGLMENVVAVRDNADRYIRFNLLYINITFIILYIYLLIEEYMEHSFSGKLIFYSIFAAILVGIFVFIFRKIVKLYYRLVYGILLKKLNRNYENLISMENEL